MRSFDTISKKISEAPSIDFGDLFNESVAVFKKVWLQGFLLQLITIALSLPLLFFNFINFSDFSNNSVPLQFGTAAVIYYSLTVVLAVVSSFLTFGFFRVIRQMDKGEDFKTVDFFYFFNTERIKKALLVVLANVAVVILALLLCVFPVFYVVIPLMFVTPIFVYNPELSISEVLKSSFALGHKKWGITFLISLLNIIALYVLILLTCGLGSLFFGCFLQMPIYVLYKKIISFDDSQKQ
ncbi:MAG: hypothetical protein ACPHP0_00695 [Flavobacteriaceae bacterium]|jgi:hypothetical protein